MSAIRLALLMAVLAAMTSASACSGSAERPGGSALRGITTSDTLPVDRSTDDISIFELELELIDQQGHRTSLADLGGKVMLAAMVYTSCTSVCPRVTEEIRAIEQQLSRTDGDLRFVLFSLDPGRDTPAAMRQFAAVHGLDTSRWRLLATSEDGVRNLAAVLGVRYRQEDDREIAHSAAIFLIDRHGVVRHRQIGTGQDSRDLVAAVRRVRG